MEFRFRFQPDINSCGFLATDQKDKAKMKKISLMTSIITIL